MINPRMRQLLNLGKEAWGVICLVFVMEDWRLTNGEGLADGLEGTRSQWLAGTKLGQ